MKGLRMVIASPHARHNTMEITLREHLGIEILRIRAPSELNLSTLSDFAPRFVFFPHWSWKIPAEVYEGFECVIFHMTDLPFGRGGSPLQNLIVRGINETQLTALRCVADLDAGPIYLKRPLLLLGTAEEILLRASKLTEEMIEYIVCELPTAQPQVGEPTIFHRRTPQDGDLAELYELEKVFDYIRMLDADGYPPAFLETEHLKMEFSRASIKLDSVIADVKISRKKT
ncbi:MAG: methionyl-tRNA formyltransferase [Gammaproteobacteria bacterium HGW-Gammaproteobacteria-3]|jgi:methionyl-tRNA formyltransferase|nr:MAG: methionyl-tRNA formyltransferase [Gammaproteobacteria bacterium HGW-Gammaproteobacteria-3]